MSKQVFSIVCLVWAASCFMVQAQSAAPVRQLETWKKYTVNGENFSVMLPAVPIMVTDELEYQLKKTRIERTLGAHADGAVYTILICDNSNSRQSLKEFIAKQRELEGWRSARERSVKVDGVSGKEYSFEIGKVRSTEQFFELEGRLYEFAVTGAAPGDVRVKQFFSSIAFANVDGTAISIDTALQSSQPGADAPFQRKDVDVKPRLLLVPIPVFSSLAREHQKSGSIVLKTVFSPAGIVRDVQVVDGPPQMRELAIRASRKVRFIPAIKNGKYVPMSMQLEYAFYIE